MSKAVSGESRQSIAFVVASPITAESFLKPHIAVLVKEYDITVIGNGVSRISTLDPRVQFIDVGIERSIKPWSDLRACIALFWVFRRARYNFIQSMGPKAGLITTIAGFSARAPIRIHWFTGQVWVSRSGVVRSLLKNLDRVSSRLATHLLVDSRSQVDFLIRSGVAKSGKMHVLNHGSTCGVDLDLIEEKRQSYKSVRKILDISDDTIIVIYVGRLNQDKGVRDLLNAFLLLERKFDIHLMLVGADEESIEQWFRNQVKSTRNRVHFLGHRNDVLDLMSDADIFILPSHREGLPISMLQAGAMGLPLIGTNIYGVTDIIEEDVTGLLVPINNPEEIAGAISLLITNPKLRHEIGQSARDSILTRFSQNDLTSAYANYLSGLSPTTSINT